MALITLREKNQSDENTYEAELSFDNGMPYPIIVKNPFSDKQEKRLEWYFEEYSKFPFIKQVEFSEAAASVHRYGEDLFEQVFSHRRAYTEYSNISQVSDLEIEIIGSPAFHQLHWEALKDPDSDHALALHCPIIRKPVGHPPPMVAGQASPTLNVLLVIARPNGKQDVGYRTISRPLVEMLQNAKLPVKIDILRPGTYQALTEQLEQVTSQQGKGYYHLIHFDVHGAVLDYETLQQGRATERFLYQARFGRADLKKFSGLKAFLFLQGQKEKQADPVEAYELASLLTHHGIPIVMLNACQSAKQVGTASETSLGSRLMQSGAQTVVAMAYSVHVSAAELFMQILYEKLFEQADLSTAIQFARLSLFNDKTRRVYFNQQIDLEDWLLPVVYQRQTVALPLRDFTEAEEFAYWENEARRYEAPTTPFGFVGRDLDVLEVENRLLSQRNVLLIQGMGGAGKTTLLHHLGAWWQTTHFVEKVFYFGYDEKAWNRQQILATLAIELLGESGYKRFQPLSELAQQKMLVKRLRAERHLLMLDNLESITGANLAIQHTLPEDEQQKLQGLLRELVDGKSLILLGSRGDEAWLAEGTFAKNVYGLAGLDAEAASQLVDKILAFHGVSRYREEEAHRASLQKLLKLLAGYPLALQVVLGNLVQQTPQEILEALESGSDDTLDTGKETGDSFQDKTTNILRCIDYSYGNLSTDAQRLLLCLAPFTGVIFKDMLPKYTEKLQQQSVLADLPFEQWDSVLQEANNWGLLAPHPEVPPGFLRLQPIFPYFMRNHLQSQPDYQAAIETAFRQYYDDEMGGALANLLNSKQAQEKQMGQMLVSFEYENLSKALDLALAAQVSFKSPYWALFFYLYNTQDHVRGLVLSEGILACIEKYPAKAMQSQLGTEFVIVVDNIARQQLLVKQHIKAKQSFQKVLELIENLANISEKIRGSLSAGTYHNLGQVAQEQCQWQTAEQYYQKAMAYFIEFKDKHSQAPLYHQLGRIAQEQRQWQTAEQYYQKALAYFIEFKDKHSQAGTYHQLGIVVQEQHQWQAAEEYYQKALAIYIEFNDEYSQARTYQNLGQLAQEQRQAEQYCQKALAIFIEFNDKHSQASTYHVLGVLAEEQEQWQQAKDYYFKALTTFAEFNDSHNLAIALGSLARLHQATNDDTLPAAVAKVLGISVEEVLKKFKPDFTPSQSELF
jgi:tetratricopeptide (TPR) repeat protein